MEKKGQVTLFIIVGIVILFLIGLFVSMSDIDLSSFGGPPGEIEPISRYTQDCISSVAGDGVFAMKMQGGYINQPEEIELTDSYVNMGFRVPYWLHEQRNYMPSMSHMERELAGYIDENLHNCLDDYKDFSHEFEVEVNDSNTTVDIINDKILIETVMPLRADKKGVEEVYHWDNFPVEVDDKLGELYSLARDIMRHSNEHAFLEDYTDEMIASSDYLPFEGMDISCSPDIYFEHELKEYTQTLIMHNLDFLQFLNTDYEESGISYYDNLYKIDFTDNYYGDLSVDVMYNPDWGMDFEVTPSDSGVVEPFMFEAYNFMSTCLQVYHHRYNIEYPVMIRVLDESDPEEVFQFATPVMLKRNQPNRYGTIEGWPAEGEDSVDDLGYCLERDNMTIYGLDDDGTMTTEEQEVQKMTNSLQVYAQDAAFGYPAGVLEGVNISYQCVEAVCEIGTTGFGDEDSMLEYLDTSPHIESLFPECENGIIIAEKEGYHEALHHQTVSDETDGSQVTIDMYKLEPIDYTVKVIEERHGLIEERNLREEESVLINIENETHNFEKKVVYPADEDDKYLGELELLRGNVDYDLEIMMRWDNTLVGGTELKWETTANQVYLNDEVVFYVYYKHPSTPPSSVEGMYEYYEDSLNKSDEYPPVFR